MTQLKLYQEAVASSFELGLNRQNESGLRSPT